MISDYISHILTALGTGWAGWFFGGRQSNKNKIDNDSHQREKDFFDIVDSRTEKEVKKTVKKVTKCAKRCPHSANCPVLDLWDDEE